MHNPQHSTVLPLVMPVLDAGTAAKAASSSPASPAADSRSYCYSPPDTGLPTPTPPAGAGRVTIKLIKRQDVTQAAADQLRSDSATSSAFEQPLDLLPVSNASPLATPSTAASDSPAQAADVSVAQPPQQQQLAGPSLQPPAAPGQAPELSNASVQRIADAVAERTLAQHKRLLSVVHDGHREMLRIIKSDLSKEGKRLQAAIETQVTHPVQPQRDTDCFHWHRQGLCSMLILLWALVQEQLIAPALHRHSRCKRFPVAVRMSAEDTPSCLRVHDMFRSS